MVIGVYNPGGVVDVQVDIRDWRGELDNHQRPKVKSKKQLRRERRQKRQHMRAQSVKKRAGVRRKRTVAQKKAIKPRRPN